MKFFADFHIHSKYSRATSRDLDLENIYIGAQIKGLTVVATGDFTHPTWWQEINDKLEPAEEGLFRLKADIARACDEQVPPVCRRPVRFMLVTEISNIYKKADRTRKNHNLVFMPHAGSAEKFNRRLDAVGNIQSDGRPILGLDARDLLEIVLESDDRSFLVPAHIWTPWFSVLGSKSGFDSVEACFGDLSAHIFALETGLSSDPAMNWRVSGLDRYTLISNSDAHSVAKLAREANCFDTDLTYSAIRSAMEKAEPGRFLGTIEFFPEEGKYHVDGHRKCGVRCLPDQTMRYQGICPVCGKPLTLGVLYRVEELADRPHGYRPDKTTPYCNLIPLEDVLAETLQVGSKTKKVIKAYQRLIRSYGSELDILCDRPIDDLAKSNIPLLAEAVDRMRQNRVIFDPGYDGEFGRVRIFEDSERDTLQGQQSLFDNPDETAPKEKLFSETQTAVKEEKTPQRDYPAPAGGDGHPPELFDEPQPSGFLLNDAQQSVVDHPAGPLLISAGPGTGKTRTITCRIAALMQDKGVQADHILAVTFTNKAAEEMRQRLRTLITPAADIPLVATFHGFCWHLLKAFHDNQPGSIVDEVGRRSVLDDAVQWVGEKAGGPKDFSRQEMLDLIVEAKQLLLDSHDNLRAIVDESRKDSFKTVYNAYQRLLELENLYDFEDLLFRTVRILEQDKKWRRRIQKQYSHVFVDEFQDINFAQYRLLRAVAPPQANICVIGDPDQAIYGFRGSDVRYFRQFKTDYPGARALRLTRNYRSNETILSSARQVIQAGNHGGQSEHRDRVYSDIKGGPKLTILESSSERAEAVAIGRVMEQMVGGIGFHSVDFDKVGGYGEQAARSFKDFAVLCRTSVQARTIARQLVSAGIPCQLADRDVVNKPSIVKLMAAFRMVTRQGVYADLHHLMGLSASAISQQTLSIFKQWAYAKQLPLATALHTAHRLPIPGMSIPRQQRFTRLVRLLERLQKECLDMRVGEVLSHLVIQTTLASQVEMDDLDQLRALAHPFGKDKAAFCIATALQQDTDLFFPGVEKVAVMTLHAAKGLEFPVVFLAGCEDNLLPFRRPGGAAADPQEERRLFYVGLTRAREQLFLSWARRRTLYGQTRDQQLSAFVSDIEARLKKTMISNKKRPRKPHPEQLSLF